MSSSADKVETDWAVLGRVSGLFGVRGWMKIFSHTSPKENILNYPSWFLLRDGQWQEYKLKQGKLQGKGIVVSLEGVDDRDQAAALAGADIAVKRDQLPEISSDEFYWSDLEGLRVVTLAGVELGRVDYLFETGANDVMVVKGEVVRLLPFISQVIQEVDLDGDLITVDWDPDF
ncbi:MAG: ribosome maturation factor RimM [Sedimenticola sp.]|uniref:Ribosome maturation factor RimM n=1 Tax=Sedimenticola thiotaurini TaxID=1543721 RepID=A0A558CXS9_9GAMM|nr:ribosome maturation factor RimM [Sedimenticola sp.]TVT53579.1 MAG: ribosome maturation factor RimM [Sedimenticola thiotaurini]MCW8881520.1 ribosome maturation factor RimM [Sedimenticola sp.]MCW8947763.1 ribosome maturation factor RimM [Sedimenticola sp.]MCW8950682.1 ribosome maturation factor RimM [Sedimenticola sp.]